MNDCVLFTEMEYANERLLRCAHNDNRDESSMADIIKPIAMHATMPSNQSGGILTKNRLAALAMTDGENLQ